MKWLWWRNADQNTWTSDALQRGDLDAVKQRVLADPSYIDDRDCVGNTPLLTAICYDNLNLVQFLLEHDADPNVSLNDGYTCLLIAVESDATESINIVEALIAAGADMHQDGINGLTPLHMAAERGHVEKARLLIDAGARIDQRKELDGAETPLMEAAKTGQLETVRLLLDHGADATMRDTECNLTPLEIAQEFAAGLDLEVYKSLKKEDCQIDVDEMLGNLDLPPEQLAILKQSVQNVDLAESYIQKSKELVESGNYSEVIRILTEHATQ